MSGDEKELFLSDSAVFALVSTLATEIVRYGEKESQLLEHKKLSDDEISTIMKANTLLTVFAMLLIEIVNQKNLEMAKTVVQCWISPAVQDMVSIAFAEEIQQAAEVVTQGIGDLEKEVNKEQNDSRGE